MRRWTWRLRGIFVQAPAATRLATACFIVFLILQGASRMPFVYGYTYEQALMPCFGLNGRLLAHGFYWQPFTYMFLHAGWGHLFFNLLVLLLFGSALEAEIGSRAFVRVFLAGGVLGGLGWLGVTALAPYVPSMPDLTLSLPGPLRAWQAAPGSSASFDGALCVGASGCVFGLIGAYAALFPKRVVCLLFPIPARMKARTLVLVLVAVELAAAFLLRLQVAYAAHLFGCLAGVLCGLRMKRLGLAGDGAA